jgi:hypothetical protein
VSGLICDLDLHASGCLPENTEWTKPQRNTCYDAAKEIASPGEPSAALKYLGLWRFLTLNHLADAEERCYPRTSDPGSRVPFTGGEEKPILLREYSGSSG